MAIRAPDGANKEKMAKGHVQHGAGEDFDGVELPEYSPQQRNQGRHPIFLSKMPLNEHLAYCPDGGSQNKNRHLDRRNHFSSSCASIALLAFLRWGSLVKKIIMMRMVG